MKTELKRLLEKAELAYISYDNDDKTNGWLVLTLPEETRKSVEELAEDIRGTFSDPTILNVELSKDNLYNLEFNLDDDICTIGQILIDTTSIDGFREIPNLQLRVRVPEKINLTIEDITEGELPTKKENIPSVEIDTEGEITVNQF